MFFNDNKAHELARPIEPIRNQIQASATAGPKSYSWSLIPSIDVEMNRDGTLRYEVMSHPRKRHTNVSRCYGLKRVLGAHTQPESDIDNDSNDDDVSHNKGREKEESHDDYVPEMIETGKVFDDDDLPELEKTEDTPKGTIDQSRLTHQALDSLDVILGISDSQWDMLDETERKMIRFAYQDHFAKIKLAEERLLNKMGNEEKDPAPPVASSTTHFRPIGAAITSDFRFTRPNRDMCLLSRNNDDGDSPIKLSTEIDILMDSKLDLDGARNVMKQYRKKYEIDSPTPEQDEENAFESMLADNKTQVKHEQITERETDEEEPYESHNEEQPARPLPLGYANMSSGLRTMATHESMRKRTVGTPPAPPASAPSEQDKEKAFKALLASNRIQVNHIQRATDSYDDGPEEDLVENYELYVNSNEQNTRVDDNKNDEGITETKKDEGDNTHTRNRLAHHVYTIPIYTSVYDLSRFNYQLPSTSATDIPTSSDEDIPKPDYHDEDCKHIGCGFGNLSVMNNGDETEDTEDISASLMEEVD